MSNERKRFNVSHTAVHDLEGPITKPGALGVESESFLINHFFDSLQDRNKLIDQLLSPENLAGRDLRATVITKVIMGVPGTGSKTLADFYMSAYVKTRLNRTVVKENSTGKFTIAAREIPRSQVNQRIETPPGSWMTSIAGVVYSKKTRERVFDPIIADFRHEYYEELQNNAPRKRLFFVHARHWCGFIAAIALQAISALAKVIVAFRSAGK